VSYVFDVKDGELASDLSLAVMRLARQLRFRRPESPVSLSQLFALATLAKEGAMTLRKRLATLGPEDRDILLRAAELMTVLVDEDA
jgi:hypothetical protein